MKKGHREIEPIKISQLIELVDKDKVCLPSFQRGIVWAPGDMVELIQSLFRHYPIGTLMFLEAKLNHRFGKRSFRGTSESNFDPDYYVVDGQQRIFTVYNLLRKPKGFKLQIPLTVPEEWGERGYKFFFNIKMDLHKSLSSDDEFIQFKPADEDEIKDEKNYIKNNNRLIPLEFILEKKHILKWIKIALKDVSAKNRSRWKKNILTLHKSLMRYDLNVEKSGHKFKDEDYFELFKLLNEAGVELTLFDLLVAKLDRLGIRVRRLWEETKKNEDFKRYDIDPIYMLKIISLIRQTKEADYDYNETANCKKKDLEYLYETYEAYGKKGGKEFKKDWEDADIYLKETLKAMRTHYGAYNKKYVPYYPMIVVLAAIKWWVHEIHNKRYHHKINEKIDRWYWGSIFKKAYQATTDVRIGEHYHILRLWVKPGKKKTPTEFKFEGTKEIEKILSKVTSVNDACFKAILCIPLTEKSNARDIYDNSFLTESYKLHNHHIYPSNYLEESGMKKKEQLVEEEINNFPNRMLITHTTNESIHDDNPAEYLKKCSKKDLEPHFLFKAIIKKMKYRDFYEERERRIKNYLYDLLL